MDALYIGDIPQNFHYAIFDNNSVTLFAEPIGQDAILDCYTIYFSGHHFYYVKHQKDFTGQTVEFTDVPVSDKWYDREDSLDILCFVIAFGVACVWLTNLITSIFKKGGLLSGLL